MSEAATSPARGTQRVSFVYGAWAVAGLFQLAALSLAFALRGLFPLNPSLTRARIPYYLFARYEPLAAVLSTAVFAVALVILARGGPAALERIVAPPSARGMRAALAAWTVLMVPVAYLVYARYPLSMDEYAQTFQAELLARGRLTGTVPYALRPWFAPFGRQFFVVGPGDRIYSEYEPGWSVLLTPFALARAMWVANVVVSALTLPVCFRVVQRLGGGRQAAWIACLALALSPVFLAYATSFYSMPAHLLFNALFVMLLLGEGPRAAAGAGLAGSVALLLHQPVPHALFSLPWHVRLIVRRDWKRLFALWAGYIPGAVATIAWRVHISARGGQVGAVQGFGFSNENTLWHVEAWSEFFLWGVPAVIALAFIGLRGARARRDVLYLAASFVITGVFFLTFMHQGHGWGHRYMQPTQIAVAALAGLGAEASIRERARAARAVAAMLVGSALLVVPYRLWEVHSVVEELSAWNRVATSRAGVVFIRIYPSWYGIDGVRNDPELRSRTTVLRSVGPVPDMTIIDATPEADHWLVQLDPRTDRPAIRPYPVPRGYAPRPAAPGSSAVEMGPRSAP